MSYVVQIWAQPEGQALPEQARAIWAGLSELRHQACADEPRFVQLAQGMLKLYPELADEDASDDFWIDDLQHRPDTCVWPMGLYCGERHGVVRRHLIKHALKLGLNVADEQSGELFLSDGRIYLGDKAVPTSGASVRASSRETRAGTVRAPTRAADGARSRPVQGAERQPAVQPGFHSGHLALLIAVTSPMLMLTLAPLLPRGVLPPMMAAFCLASAWGVWRCSADLSWGVGRRALGTGVALVPFLSMFPSTYLLIAVLRARRD